MTDCQQFDALIVRTGTLTPEEAAILDAHLATCNACRDLARLMKPLDVAFQFTVSDTLGDPKATGSDHEINHRYRITGEVGRGGIGRVMEALDQVLDRPVALKELFSGDSDLRQRFVREALITARLQHPSIVPIYDAGHLGDRSPFYAMKLVAGQPLHTSIETATTLAQRLALLPHVLAVADAMAYAHSKRIIHRDLKPQNILVGAFGETIVIDWGLAKDLALDEDEAHDPGPYRSSGTRTVAGTVMGTPAFMAPEQAARESVDERADVYALGAILYQLVCGQPPHEGTTLEEVLAYVIAGDIRPLAKREPDVPRDLAAIITKAMALSPANRYANAGGLAEDLRRFLTGQLVGSHSYGVRELARRWVKRHRTAVAVALSAFVAIAIVGVVGVTRVVQERNTARASLSNLLEEQGRQELLVGQPARAAVYLSEAFARSRDPGVGLRTLLAHAMHSEQLPIKVQVAEQLERGALSADGAKVVERNLWDARTGKLLFSLDGTSAAFDASGTRVITTHADSAKVWDATTGAQLVSLAHPGAVETAAFSMDGTRVITSIEQRLWIWSSTGSLIATFEPTPMEYPVRLSKDATRILVASGLGTASIKSVDTGKPLVELATTEAINAAAFSLDGSSVATASLDRTVKIWNTQTGALISSLEGTTRLAFAAWFSPDGARLITVSDNDSAKLWDVATGKLLVSYDGHKGDIRDVIFSADGRVLTTSDDRTVKLWDERTGRLLASFDAEALDAKFSPDGSQLTIASHDGQISIFDIHLEQRTPEEIQSIVTAHNPWTLSDGVLLPKDR